MFDKLTKWDFFFLHFEALKVLFSFNSSIFSVTKKIPDTSFQQLLRSPTPYQQTGTKTMSYKNKKPKKKKKTGEIKLRQNISSFLFVFSEKPQFSENLKLTQKTI
jgi:hypothetical protein